MRILVVHNRYRREGGEDVEVAAEAEALAAAGHTVKLETVDNDALKSVVERARTFVSAPYDHDRYIWMTRAIEAFAPDVVHVHNFFPRLTPAVHHSVSEAGVALVQTLHNYRLLCANALFLRQGQVCEKCLHGTRYWGVVHRCYRHSVPGSLAVVRMQNRAFAERIWERVDEFIALTEFGRSKFMEGGLPGERISVKPNTLAPDWDTGPDTGSERSGVLFVGRLSPEKGIDVLLGAWRSLPDVPLTILGDGPERTRLEAAAPPNVVFKGAVSHDRVREHMRRALCLVVPSLWYEGFGLVAIEAFSMSLPVVCSRIGALAEVVVEGESGWHFTPGSSRDLARTLQSALSDHDALRAVGRRARDAFLEKFSPAQNVEVLTQIYARALARASARRGQSHEV